MVLLVKIAELLLDKGCRKLKGEQKMDEKICKGSDRVVQELEPLLSSNYENMCEMPDVRKSSVKANIDYNDNLLKEIQALSGLKKEEEPKPKEKNKPIIEDRVELAPNAERYKSFDGLRKEWASKAENATLAQSGMPSYMQLISEGKENESDVETLDYCKLAGLRYKTSKEKLHKEMHEIKSIMYSALSEVEERLERLAEEYKKLEYRQ
jgi:hypothetical protein